MRSITNRSKIIKPVIIILAAALLMMIMPVAVQANIPNVCRYVGPVTVNGENVDLDTTQVFAWVDGVSAGPWQAVISFNSSQQKSWYILDVPKDDVNTPEKDGAMNRDVVQFGVTTGGMTYSGSPHVFMTYETYNHPLNVETPLVGQIEILKVDESDTPLEGASFVITPDPKTGTGSLTIEDNLLNDEDPAGGTLLISGALLAIEYNIHESAAPSGYTAGEDQVITLNSINKATLVFVNTQSLPLITTTTMTDATVGVSYNRTIQASGGTLPYNWEAAGLPNGLSIDPLTGVISGAPQPLVSDYAMFTPANSNTAVYNVTVSLEDDLDLSDSKDYTLTLRWIVGDANGNGQVNMQDVSYVEQALLTMMPETPGCDANLDGIINILDPVWIEWIILNQP